MVRVEHHRPARDDAAVPADSVKIRVSRRALGAIGLVAVLFVAALVALEVNRIDAANPTAGGAPVAVRVIAFNDLHGNLGPPTGSSGKVQPGGGASVDAGGAAFLATKVAQLRAAAPNSVLVSAGDNIAPPPSHRRCSTTSPPSTCWTSSGWPRRLR